MKVSKNRPALPTPGPARIQPFDPANNPGSPIMGPVGIPHQLVTAIRNSPKGKVPPGVAKYMRKKGSK